MGPWLEVLAGTCIVFRHLEPLFTCQKRGWGRGISFTDDRPREVETSCTTIMAIENGRFGRTDNARACVDGLLGSHGRAASFLICQASAARRGLHVLRFPVFGRACAAAVWCNSICEGCKGRVCEKGDATSEAGMEWLRPALLQWARYQDGRPKGHPYIQVW